MFNCDKCTRLEHREILDGQNPDEYTLPFCKKYDKQLFTDINHFFTKGAVLVPCEECKKDEYEYFMEKSKEKIDMSYKEALEIIDMALAEVEWNYPLEQQLDYTIAFNKAKEAIEKQITTRTKGVLCPNCNYDCCPWDEPDYDYCPKCGQKLKH